MEMQQSNAQARDVQMLPDSNIAIKNANREVRLGFIRKVYGILIAQLAVTLVVGSFFYDVSPQWIQQHRGLMFLSMAVTVSTLIAMTCCQHLCRSFPTNYILLFTFTAFEGIMLGIVSAGYTAGSVLGCVAVTLLVFSGLTVYAFKTKTDFTGYGPYLFGVFLTFIAFGFVLSILSWCGVYIPMLRTIYSIAGVLIFVMYIVFDTQLIIGQYGGHKCEFGIDDYVFAALTLYLDIVNLFLYLLELFGDRRQ